MAEYPIPSWIRAADPVTHYMQGLQIGSQIAAHQAAIDQEQQRIQVQREEAAQRAIREMSQAEIHKATLEANLGLREQELQDARDRAMQAFELNKVRTDIAGQALALRQQAEEARRQAEEAKLPLEERRVGALETQAAASMLRATAPPKEPPQKATARQTEELKQLHQRWQDTTRAIAGMQRLGGPTANLPGMSSLTSELQNVNRDFDTFWKENPELDRRKNDPRPVPEPATPGSGAALAPPPPGAQAIPAPTATQVSSGTPRPARTVKDKKGVTWLYLGDMPDPTQDRDPKHWTKATDQAIGGPSDE